MNRTLGAFYAHLKQKLAEITPESADLEARSIIKHHFNLEWSDIIAKNDQFLPENGLIEAEKDLKRRMNGEPISKIQGFKGFYGREFVVSAATLDPRPETEILIDRALELFPVKHPARILDLGTGTGCIIITLLKEWPDAKGVAIDISPDALEIARINAQTHGVADRLQLIQGDWANGINEKFDLVVSNPPYIRTADIENLQKEVRNHDPILALDGGFDGLDPYKKIFFSLNRLLTPCGKALFEIGAGQADDIARLSGESRIRVEYTHPDYAGIPRVVEISNGDN